MHRILRTGTSEALAPAEENFDDVVRFVRDRYLQRLEIAEQTRDPRYIVYDCTSTHQTGPCGGYGNRLLSMGYLFAIALLTDSRFVVFSDQPVRLDNYLGPIAELDWKRTLLDQYNLYDDYQNRTDFHLMEELLDAGAHVTNHYFDQSMETKCADPIVFLSKGMVSVTNTFFSGADPPQVVGIRTRHFDTNRMVHSLPEYQPILKEYKLQELSSLQWAHVMMRLFISVPTDGFMQLMQPTLQRLTNSHVVGVQMRMGQAVDINRWKDPARGTMAAVPCMVEQARAYCKNAPSDKKCVVWATSDSPSAINGVVNSFKDTDTDVAYGTSQIFHSDWNDATRNQTQAMLTHFRTFEDWFVLAHVAKANVVSMGSFGYSAAYYNPISRPVSLLVEENTCYMYEQTSPNEKPSGFWSRLTLLPFKAVRVTYILEWYQCLTGFQ